MFTNTPTDQLTQLHETAKTIEAEGGKMTPAFVKSRQAWQRFAGLEPNYVDQLTRAVVGDHEPEEVAHLLTLACASAEVSTSASASVRQEVARTVLASQRQEFTKTAEANYEKARRRYNDAAAELTGSLALVDPDADPAQLMSADEAQRVAWGAVQVQAAALDEALEFLRLTATHVGIGDHDSDTLALGCNPGPTADRRAVWGAWDDAATSRAGRWAALVRMGVTLTAGESGKHQPYRRAKPIETRYMRGETGLRRVDYDPETDTPKGAVVAGAHA